MNGLKQFYKIDIDADTPIFSVPGGEETLTGTFTSTGKKFVGTGSAIQDELEVGDYIYIPSTDEVRRVIRKQPFVGKNEDATQQFFVNLPLDADVTDEADVIIIPSGSISAIEIDPAGANCSYLSAYQASLQTVGGSGLANVTIAIAADTPFRVSQAEAMGAVLFVTGATSTITGHWI